MGMRRTTVFADEADLAVIKRAAARRGVPEAELLREAVHRVAMAERTWDEAFFRSTYDARVDGTDHATAVAQSRGEQARSYERARTEAP